MIPPIPATTVCAGQGGAYCGCGVPSRAGAGGEDVCEDVRVGLLAQRLIEHWQNRRRSLER